ncbi:MAG: tetratricopeptide repeat protein [Prevotella buccalis]|nr:tetratricopeptide repeat protein [Hoylesella buccalis]
MLGLFVMALCVTNVYAQSDRQFIRSGNKLYRSQNYAKAEAEYRKAIAQNGQNPQALYNFGCALMMQQKDSAAIVQYENAGKLESSKSRKAKIFHNIGVICQNHQMYGEAIEAYKESLRNNPDDNETRYNLALCKRQQKNQKQNGGEQKKKDDQKGKDKQKKDDQQQKQQDQQQQQKNKPKDRMSKENAEQLLNAATQQEKATQQRMKKAMRQSGKKKLKKNW